VYCNNGPPPFPVDSTASATAQAAANPTRSAVGPARSAASADVQPLVKVTAKYHSKVHVVSPDAAVPHISAVRRFTVTLPDSDGVMEDLVLWVPAKRDGVEDWWVVPEEGSDSTLTLTADIDPADSISFPIFMPSCGRDNIALIDLSQAIPERRYNQIVVVKAKEADEYRRGRPDFTFLVLPPSADDLGIGASRYWILEFAKQTLRDHPQPNIFVADDNISFWRGETALLTLV
jgi:hypothetical protein